MKRLIIIFSLFCFSANLSAQSNVLQSLEKELVDLVDKVKASVVTVQARIHVQLDDPKELAFDDPSQQSKTIEMTNIGSGIIISEKEILTRASVVDGCESITLQFCDSSTVQADLKSLDSQYGFAILSVKEGNLKPVRFAEQAPALPGSWVTIMGNSLGVAPGVSVGIVNGIRPDGLLQISANITAGSVGGPIFNTRGELVGMIAAKISSSPSDPYAGSEFMATSATLAYPVDFLSAQVKRLENIPLNKHGWIGVSAEDYPGQSGWVHISNVIPSSPADKAGLESGDLVKGVDQQSLQNARDLAEYIRSHEPGTTIKLSIQRGDTAHSIPVTLGESDTPLQQTVIRTSYSSSQVMSTRPTPTNQREIMQRIRQMERELRVLRSMVK